MTGIRKRSNDPSISQKKEKFQFPHLFKRGADTKGRKRTLKLDKKDSNRPKPTAAEKLNHFYWI